MATNNELERLRLLMQQRHHQQATFWSRVQTLYAVQAAVLVGAYSLREEWYGWAILLLGILLTSVVGLLSCYDWQDVRANEDELFRLCDVYRIRWSAEPTGIRKYVASNHVLMWTVLLLAGLDVVLGNFYFCTWSTAAVSVKIPIVSVASVLFIVGASLFRRYWTGTGSTPNRDETSDAESPR